MNVSQILKTMFYFESQVQLKMFDPEGSKCLMGS